MTHLDPRLAARALSARAPRYTSYPPATWFTDAVGPALAGDWLGRVNPAAPVSLYVHVPFCRRLCWFCACRTQGTKTDAPLTPYLDALEAEIALIADRLPDGIRVGHLHFGGGTPTLLSPAHVARLTAMLDARLPRTPDAETSVEIDPTEIDEARLDAWVAAGLTRASLGVQDFAPAVQAAIGRPQSFEQTVAAMLAVRARGVGGVNLDLLYGLPHQCPESFGETLGRAISLNPDRIALYGYAHVPWASKRQVMIREADLPTPDTRLAMTAQAADAFERAGYVRIGIDHFARPDDLMAVAARTGRLRRNFQGYTTDRAETLLGLGASAISRLPGGYAQNAARTADWTAAVRRGRLATARGHALTAEDGVRGAMIERLMCDFAIDPKAFPGAARVAAMLAPLAARWAPAVRIGADGVLRVAAGAEQIVRLMALELDAYAMPDGRHAAAV